MSFFEQFKDKKVTLLGAGVSNKPLVAKLAEGGAKIEIRDKKTLEQMGDAAAEFVAAGAEFVSGEGYLEDIDGDYVFRSPGFRPDIEPLVKAQERGV